MFETRVKIVLVLLAVTGTVMVGRLFQLQILQNETYAAKARETLISPERHLLAFVRGGIRTSDGVLLASDEPSWEICLHYGMLSGDLRYLGGLVDAGLTRSQRSNTVLVAARREDIFQKFNETWTLLGQFGQSHEELLRRRDAICAEVQREKRAVSRNLGFDENIASEFMAHPIVYGLNDQEQIDARRVFAEMPWIEIQPSARRVYAGNRAFAHFLGRMGEVTQEIMARYPRQTDPDQRYLPGETAGVAGLERDFEQVLRGKRGWVVTDREGNTLSHTAAVDGTDLVLTIDHALQSDLYNLMARNIESLRLPGGAAVVVHVPTREVTAMVSYPSFDLNRLRDSEYYRGLQEDTRSLPLLFRAANAMYPPGSIVKPVAILAGLATGAVTLSTTEDCQGYRFPDQPAHLREWRDAVTKLPMRHGQIDAIGALQHSCNIYCYHLAEKLGIDSLSAWLSRFGLGRPSGIGLTEDLNGIVPSPEWLRSRGRDASVTDARNAVIGQGDLTVTPLQTANMFATVVSGFYKPLTLVRNHGIHRPVEPITGIQPSHLQAVKKGLYSVVNEPGGTAFHTANLHRSDYVLCGKTGSAECEPRMLAYDVRFQIGDGEPRWETLRVTYAGGVKSLLSLRYGSQTPITILEIRRREQWPPEDAPDYADPSHAWFAGYVLPRSARIDQTPEYVFVVLLEFGGSGGRAAGPVGKEIAGLLIGRGTSAVASADARPGIGGSP